MENKKDSFEDQLIKLYHESHEDFIQENLSTLHFYSKLSPEKLRYQNQTKIAEGGSKIIYKVFDPKTQTEQALARLKNNSKQEEFEPFLREAYLTAQLDHPNIINVMDIGLDENGVPYYIMELKKGLSLNEKVHSLHKGDSEINLLETSLDIFLKVCEAMVYAHSRKILHLDLKPDNIQVGIHGDTIICDWGMGKLLKPSNGNPSNHFVNDLSTDTMNHMTLSGVIKGTPEYMAPEQFSGNEKSPQTDIYAMGLILYYMLVGKSLCKNMTLTEIRHKKIEGFQEHDYDSLFFNLPQSLQAIIKRALQNKPSERYSSVSQIVLDIRKFLSGQSTFAEQASWTRELWLFYKRNNSLVHLATISSLSLLTLFYTIFVWENQEKVTLEQSLKELIQEKENRDQFKKEPFLDMYQQALSALSEYRLNDAEVLLRQVEQLNPTHLETKNLIASLHFLRHDYQSAEEAFASQMNDLYIRLKMLNDYYLKKKSNEKNEIFFIEHLLKSCQQHEQALIRPYIYHHFLSDKRSHIQELAFKYFSLRVEDSLLSLKMLNSILGSTVTMKALDRVIDTLLENKNWIERRQAVSKAITLSQNEDQINKLKRILPLNLALGQKVFSNKKNIHVNDLKGVVDQVLSEESPCWNASLYPDFIVIDLGSPCEIKSIDIFFKLYNYTRYDDKKYDYSFTVEHSLDKTNYYPLLKSNIKTQPINQQQHSFEPINSRYIKVYISSNDLSFNIHLKELKIF